MVHQLHVVPTAVTERSHTRTRTHIAGEVMEDLTSEENSDLTDQVQIHSHFQARTLGLNADLTFMSKTQLGFRPGQDATLTPVIALD